MSTETTKEVLNRHMTTLLAGDVDGIVADYAPDAVIISAQRVVRGIDAVRAMFAAIPAGAMGGFEITHEVCEGEIAFIEWKSTHMKFGTDTFVVRGGKIVAQTVAHA